MAALAFAHSRELDEHVLAALDAASLTAIAHAYVLDLDRSQFGAYRAEANIYPASVIKVAVMAEVFHQFAQGSIAPDQTVVVSGANQTTTAEPTPFESGYRAAIVELVEYMITRSDNIATNQLLDIVRRENVTAFMRELGLPTFLLGRKLSGSEPLIVDTEMVGRNRMPPEEIGRLLALIACDAVPGAAEQRRILAGCVHNEKLVPGLSSGDRFMHKTGETDEQSHDAGILVSASGRRYVIVLYTTPEPLPGRSDARHADASMTTWMHALRTNL